MLSRLTELAEQSSQISTHKLNQVLRSIDFRFDLRWLYANSLQDRSWKRPDAIADQAASMVPFSQHPKGKAPSRADTTGGNAGSAVMNKRGELIGLNFDPTYESITKDWYFDPKITRAIHTDILYMLWVMKEVDHADNILQEMTIKYPKEVKNKN